MHRPIQLMKESQEPIRGYPREQAPGLWLHQTLQPAECRLQKVHAYKQTEGRQIAKLPTLAETAVAATLRGHALHAQHSAINEYGGGKHRHPIGREPPYRAPNAAARWYPHGVQ